MSWYLILAAAGFVPPLTAVVAAMNGLDPSLIAIYALAGLAYIWVVQAALRPVLISLRLGQSLRRAEQIAAITDGPSRNRAFEDWRNLSFLPPDVRAVILAGTDVPAPQRFTIPVNRIRELLVDSIRNELG